MTERQPDFVLVLVGGAPYEAELRFYHNLDICGEGYVGVDIEIMFIEPRFNSPLWSWPDNRCEDYEGNVDRDRAEAMGKELYNEVVALLKAVQS